MGFGFRNALSHFRRWVMHVFGGLEGVTMYVDDILVQARTTEELLERLEAVFDRIREEVLINLENGDWRGEFNGVQTEKRVFEHRRKQSGSSSKHPS